MRFNKMKFYIWNETHLGDIIMALNSIYSRNIELGIKFEIYGPSEINYLLDFFDYQGLIYKDLCNIEVRHMKNSLSSLFPIAITKKLDYGFTYFTSCNLFSTEDDCGYISKVYFPKPKQKIYPENVIYFQFDSRSVVERKKKFSTRRIHEFIADNTKFFDGEILGIGGLDTIQYTDKYPLIIGNLNKTLHCLAGSCKFIGIDSGMSHIAGMLGLPGEILVCFDEYKCFCEVEAVYSMYPNLNCYFRGYKFL
ncbi:MAG: hypothetical protein WCG45_04805 [bacterium]